MSESLAFAVVLVAIIAIMYFLYVGVTTTVDESFYGRWRTNSCACTNGICRCPMSAGY